MVSKAKGGLSNLLFNLRNLLNHRLTVISITAVLAIYVLWQAGSLVWNLWLLDEESPQAAMLVPAAPGSAEPESFEDLLRYPLIQPAPEPGAVGSASTDAPKTSLNLKLVGLMYSTDGKQARAIIESEQDGARSYSVHERVADKAEIYRIEADRVILLHAGRREALMLDPEDTAAGARAASDSPAIGGPTADRPSAESQASTGPNPETNPRKLDDVMNDFAATPVMEAGNLVGFRLEAVRDPELLAEWGIGPDDVITAVNGMPLNSQGRIMVLYDKLKKQSEFELTLDNGGSSRTVTVELHD